MVPWPGPVLMKTDGCILTFVVLVLSSFPQPGRAQMGPQLSVRFGMGEPVSSSWMSVDLSKNSPRPSLNSPIIGEQARVRGEIRTKRRPHPLTGSNTWVEYEGTTVVRKVWNGRANLVELKADGPAGHFEGLNLRLYNPNSRQWSLNFANINDGTLTQPTIGEFKNGRGEFFDQETLNGRAILVRFVVLNITPRSCRFQQSFSDDGGKTWEVNWIAIDTR